MNIEDILEKLEILYRDIDAKADILVRIHGNRLKCRMGCAECCMDDITVFEVEAENIRRYHSVLLNTGIPSQDGCAFLDESGACRIYPQRPYVCRTQGLPLRWLEELDDDALVEMRDICPLNEEGDPVELLPEDACWTIGPVEERLAVLQKGMGNGDLRRTALRSLFVKKNMKTE